jgi:hypothetical protein
MTKILSRLFCGLAAVLVLEAHALGQSSVVFFVDLTRVVTLHEPVLFTTNIVNDSDADLSVEMGFDTIERFEFEVVSPSGLSRTVRPHVVAPEGVFGPPLLVLGPRGRADQSRDKLGGPVILPRVLNQWVDFESVGTYRITVRFGGTIRAGSGVSLDGVLRNQTLMVTVGPRDEGVLRRKALLLLQEAGGRGPGKNLAAQQLSYMSDPALVPILERGTVELVNGAYCQTLGRIGTAEARQALERLAQVSIPSVGNPCKEALLKMK